MKAIRKGLSLLIVVVMLLSLSSCVNPKESARQKFEKLTNTIFIEFITYDTLSLHYTVANPKNFGINDYPITLGSYSEESIQAGYAEYEKWLAELNSINYDFLTVDQQLTYDILLGHFTTELEAADLYLYTEPLSSVSGDHLNLPILLAEYAFNTRQDISDYLALLETVEPYYREIIDFETRKSEAGLFMADFSADLVIKTCQEFIATPDSNYLIERFDDKIDDFPDLTEEEKATYKAANRELVLNNVVAAYNILIEGLTSLKGTGKNEAGLSNFANGKSYFKYIVKSEVGSKRSIRKIKSMIMNKLDQDRNQIIQLLKKDETILDKMLAIDLMTDDFQSTLSELSEKMLVNYPAGPEVTYTVKQVHPSMAESASPAFYIKPTIDQYDANVIYVNGEADIQTLAHEGFPGHMYQSTYFAATNPAKIRLIINIKGYSEGWATYAELSSIQMSGLDEDMAVALDANYSYTLGIYSLVDIGINYDGWTRQDTADFLNEIGISEPDMHKQMFENIVGSPGNYLNYYVGYLEILELKEDAEEALGSGFDLKAFNKFLLDVGPACFDILSDKLDNFLEWSD